MQSYFKVPKDVKLHTMHFFMKMPKTRELEQIAYNNSSDIDSKFYEPLPKMQFKTTFFSSYS